MIREEIENELIFKFTRSGGAGGQHVNKVSSKVFLQWHVNESKGITVEEKEIVQGKLINKINTDGYFFLEADTERSQHRNKEIAVSRFFSLLEEALKPIKPRKKTKIPYSSVLKRLDRKAHQSDKKSNRNWKMD